MNFITDTVEPPDCTVSTSTNVRSVTAIDGVVTLNSEVPAAGPEGCGAGVGMGVGSELGLELGSALESEWWSVSASECSTAPPWPMG